MLVGSNGGAVDHDFFPVRVAADGPEQALPNPGLGPAGKAREGGVPVAQLRGQITPGAAHPPNPEHRF